MSDAQDIRDFAKKFAEMMASVSAEELDDILEDRANIVRNLMALIWQMISDEPQEVEGIGVVAVGASHIGGDDHWFYSASAGFELLGRLQRLGHRLLIEANREDAVEMIEEDLRATAEMDTDPYTDPDIN